MTSFDPREWRRILNNLPESPETDCSYFGDRMNQVTYFFSDAGMTPKMQEEAINMGFRRCGDTWYRTICPDCNMCITQRVKAKEFVPSKNQKRVLRRNRDIACTIATPNDTREKEEIYLRYQYSQHFQKPPFVRPGQKAAEFDPSETLGIMQYQMYTNPKTSLELEMRLDEQLVGFGIMDVAVTTTSLVYFVFDPDFHRRSLGTLNILWSIEWSRKNGFDHVNLGYYIPGHMKMDYKSRFKPSEMLDSRAGKWGENIPNDIQTGPEDISC